MEGGLSLETSRTEVQGRKDRVDLQGVAGKGRGPISCFPLNGQSGCPLQTRERHQEGGVLSNSSGQGTGASVDHGLWAPSSVWCEGRKLDYLCIGDWVVWYRTAVKMGLWLFHTKFLVCSTPS